MSGAIEGVVRMDIFDYAMQMEKDGEEYYRRLAGQIENKGLIAILTMLADEEAKHYEALERLKSGRPEMTETTILDGAKNVFSAMDKGGGESDLGVGQIDLYKTAQDIERKSEDFYRSKAGEVQEEHEKELFLRLAEEEKKHYFLLENIIEFVSRPTTWLENAEFCHLQEY